MGKSIWSLGYQNGGLPRGIGSLRNYRRGLQSTFIVRYQLGSDQESYGEKKNTKDKDKIMSFCWCFYNHFYYDHDYQIRKKQFGIVWKRNMLEMKEFEAWVLNLMREFEVQRMKEC